MRGLGLRVDEIDWPRVGRCIQGVRLSDIGIPGTNRQSFRLRLRRKAVRQAVGATLECGCSLGRSGREELAGRAFDVATQEWSRGLRGHRLRRATRLRLRRDGVACQGIGTFFLVIQIIWSIVKFLSDRRQWP